MRAHTHTDQQHPILREVSYRTIFGAVPGAAGQADAHEGGRETSQEDSQRPGKNGFVNGGIQQREGFSKGVFRQTAKGFFLSVLIF